MEVGCTKIQHRSRRSAVGHLVGLKQRRKPHEAKEGRVTPYLCRRCGFWHIGHKRPGN